MKESIIEKEMERGLFLRLRRRGEIAWDERNCELWA